MLSNLPLVLYLLLVCNVIPITPAENVDFLTLTQIRQFERNEFIEEFFRSSQIFNTSKDAEWSSQIGASCALESSLLMNGFQNNDLWALRVFDAWGKFPSGILEGHLLELGNFDECILTNKLITVLGQNTHFKGKYCLASIPLEEILNVKIGICMPSTCNAPETDAMLKSFLQHKFNYTVNATINLVKETSCSVAEKPPFRILDWIAIIVFSLLGLLVTLGTGYDYFIRRDPNEGVPSPFWMAFSLKTNFRQLLKTSSLKSSSKQILCLHGIRALSIIWVVFGHSYMMAILSPNINSAEILQWMQTVFSMVLRSGTASVDSFFFLSGLLVGLVALRSMDKTSGKLNIPMMYLHRYLRLTPVMALSVLFYMTLYSHLSNGPLWNAYTATNKLCDGSWWATLLYVQNYAKPGEMCLGHTWYLAVDTQLYVFSPLFLYVIWKWNRKGLAALTVLLLLLFACLFSIIMINDLAVFKAGKDALNLENDLESQRMIYYSTHTRASPWLIGLMFGYYLHHRNNRKTVLSKWLILTGWFTSLTLLFTIVFCLFGKTQSNATPLTTAEGAAFLAFSRIAWPLALCWIVFACVNSFSGPVNAFLSWSFWQPISKLSYCMYISHLLVQTLNTGRTRINFNFSDYDNILRFWGDFGITMMVSLVMFLCIEAPMVGLENILLKKSEKTANAKPSTTISQQNLCD